ncbi:MAG TPA: alpha-L-fucosidase [Gemmatimonadales bacterium]|nr:alpha-L-fucosidase [Gemmatimonadales bacterium]
MNRRELLSAGASAALAIGALPLRAPGSSGWRRGSEGRDPRRRPAKPDGPRPTPQQLAWQRAELALFVHFTVNTFTDREWGDGTEHPRIFHPARLDARQWARVAQSGGFRTMILTAKHHDGFCLWPTETTTHSVRSSPWRDGRGDVVGEFVDACRAAGLGVGLYLSPWDRHEPSYGDSPRYNDLYARQLTELLTRYGPIVEVWFDGANGEGPNGRRQEYDWPRVHGIVRKLQPKAVIFSDAGPDIRWVGNEKGIAGDPNWCTVDPATVPYPGVSGDSITRALQHGDAHGSVWRPGEADVSIRPGWFWHDNEDDKVRTAENLVELYCSSVGRNAGLLLNVPPTRDGLFHTADVARIAEFGERRRAIFATNLAAGARAHTNGGEEQAHPAAHVADGDPDSFWRPAAGVTTGWVELELAHPATFDLACLQEAIAHGQNVERYTLQAWTGSGGGGAWTTLARGTTIGHKKLDRFPAVTSSRVRLAIDAALDTPCLANLALYRS